MNHITITNLKISYLIIFFLFSLSTKAQEIVVRNIPSLNNLPVNAIHRIFQDSDGYMWYGTTDGLCRYDGYNIRLFRSDLNHPGLLVDNSISFISEDQEKKIWFGTMKGAYILDKATYQITPINLEEYNGKVVFHIHVTKDGTIWISVEGALFHFRPNGTLIKRYQIEYNNHPECIYFIYENNSEDYIISFTKGGMYKFNAESGRFTPYFHNDKYMDVERIIWDAEHKCYWLGVWGAGIVRFNPEAESENEIYVPQPLPKDIMGETSGSIYHMVQDDVFHYLWITAWRDLFAFRITENGTLEQVDTSSFLNRQNKILYDLHKDKDGKLWISASDVESFIVDIREYIVKEYPLESLRNRINANPSITSLCIDTKGIFWFMQDRYGLCTYDPQTNNLKHFSESHSVRSLPLWYIPKIVQSRISGMVWAVPYGSSIYGLKLENMHIEECFRIQLNDISENPGLIISVFEDDNKNVWIGTTMGLFVYSIKTGSLNVIREAAGYISGIVQTGNGTVWAVIKNKGIFEIEVTSKNKLHKYKRDFTCINTTTDGKLWVGTGEGEVLMFDPTSKEGLTNYSLACGMEGDIINNITVDTYNHVWITTNQMIKEFNPRNSAYRIYNTRNPNFLLTRLSPDAVSYNNSGEIYWGGINGVISISPSQQLESIPEQVQTLITDIKLLGKSIWENNLTEDPILSPIKILPDDQNLEIEFSALDYHNQDQIRYAYRMIGVDNDWIYLNEGKNSAFYNKLNKGKYTFQVKATDKNGLWSNKITKITIHRLPAWYETWWAYMIYMILFLGIIWTIIHLYLQKLKQENTKKLTEQVTQMKLRYFTNISHDLMTPLTIFSCVVDEIHLAGKEDPKRIALLQSNIIRLKRLLQQVLDFRKAESGNLQLNVSWGNISSFVKDICETGFAPLIKSKQIRFGVEMEPHLIEGYFDFDKLDKILFNLLSNAFKYTLNGKEVRLNIKSFEQNTHKLLQIAIYDEGRGIEKKEQNKIFTRFYNNKLSETGMSNGIGLSLVKELVELHHGTISLESELGKGSIFTVTIPIDKSSYSKEERTESLNITANNIIPTVEISERYTEKNEDTRKSNILLVEDNEELLSLMQEIFSRKYNAFTASNGKQALAFISRHDIDLIISDIMMPEMDGLELCRTIKNNIQTSHIIVILLTAKTTTEDRIESYQVNADEYISKPFEMNVLRARIENLLRLRKQKQDAFNTNPKIEISRLEVSSLDEQLIEQALKIVEENLGDPNFDISKLAGKLNMTRITLSRKIKGITGHSPLEFIRDIKMKYACQMLENPNMSVSEVIIAIGYRDHGHFTTTFKDMFGITPSEYQKKVQTI